MASVRVLARDFFRRKIVRLVGAYLAVFWLLSVGLASLLPALGAPSWTMRAFVVMGLAVIPALVFISWKYRVVPPQLFNEEESHEAHPTIGWARVRHETKDAGFVLLSWGTSAGGATERRFFQPVAIGRDPINDVEFADPRVSRYHALLWAEGGAWHIRDLDSANGTFVDAIRVTGTARLPSTCELRFHVNGPVVGVTVARTQATLVG